MRIKRTLIICLIVYLFIVLLNKIIFTDIFITLFIILTVLLCMFLNLAFFIYLRKQEEYKSMVFQSISHDLKTPLAVISSHIEALDDKMIDDKEFLNIVKTQINTLEFKVSALLYSNKLNYLKDLKTYQKSEIDIKEVIKNSLKKFKYRRNDITYKTNISGNTIFKGTIDAWEAIIDNILNNFMRYAKKEIVITVRNNQVILYNDGSSINENVLKTVFNPYKKGSTGLFGLGLNIVKRTLNMLGYEIKVMNEKKGISFIIN